MARGSQDAIASLLEATRNSAEQEGAFAHADAAAQLHRHFFPSQASGNEATERKEAASPSAGTKRTFWYKSIEL